MRQEEDTITPEKNPAILFQGNLRDWFAGQALVGLSIQDGMAASQYIAGESYKIADAMIAERDENRDLPETPTGDPYNGWRMTHDGVTVTVFARDDTWEIRSIGRREGPSRICRVDPLDGSINPLGQEST